MHRWRLLAPAVLVLIIVVLCLVDFSGEATAERNNRPPECGDCEGHGGVGQCLGGWNLRRDHHDLGLGYERAMQRVRADCSRDADPAS